MEKNIEKMSHSELRFECHESRQTIKQMRKAIEKVCLIVMVMSFGLITIAIASGSWMIVVISCAQYLVSLSAMSYWSGEENMSNRHEKRL